MKPKQQHARLERRLDVFDPKLTERGFNRPGSIKKPAPEPCLKRAMRRKQAGLPDDSRCA